MAYTTQQAVVTLNGYLSIEESKKRYIDDTKNRGFVITLENGENIVIFVYPLVHKQDNTKNYFDTRDSGAYERGVAWRYALQHGLKYFCFGVNDQVDKFSDYVFSLECNEKIIEKVSGTKDGARNGKGNQIIIPNDYIPYEKFERIKNRLGIYISAVRKDGLADYLSLYDNRPYLAEDIDIEIEDEDPEEHNKRLFRYWMSCQVKPEGDSDAGHPYSEASIDQYVSNVANTPLSSMPDRSVFYTTNVGEVQITIEALDNSEKKNNTQRSAVRKYMEYLSNIVSEEDCDEVFNHRVFGMHIKQENNALSEENPHVCIGWSDLGDLSEVSSKEELANLYDEYFDKNPRGKGQDVGQVWRFLNDMQIGDYVILAENSVFHIGRVESEYYYDNTDNPEQSADYKNNRTVRWLKKNISRNILSSNLHKSLMTAMSIFTLNDYKSAVADLLRGTYIKDEDRTEVEEEIMDLIFNTSLTTKYERNRIVFGAPGTGKSHKLKEDCEEMMNNSNGSFERVTFHPEYSYSQFVGTYKPVMGDDGETIKYSYVPGPFMRMYVEALKSGRTENPQPHLLLIEEINRAKVVAVFGDVFQLLDRDDDGVSEYEIQASEDIRKYLAKELGGSPENYKRIRIPNNMFIWATMNSADQGVFPMDTAFKRRWNFEYLGIDENEEKIKGIGKIMLAGTDEPIEWNRLRKAINAKMSSSDFKINEDKLMGPFFLSKKVVASDENRMIIDKDEFIKAFKSKVIMYLYEDAVKQGKHRFYEGCPDTGKYSAVCDAFDTMGIAIFGPTFRETFYDKED
jgi:hypothetical protein